MDQFQLAITTMASIDTRWGRRDADGRRRPLSAEELDALAELGWNWPDPKRLAAAFTNAILSRWRPRVSNQREPTRLPSAEATAQG